MAGTVVAREALDRQAEEDACDFRCLLVSKVQTVERLQVVTVDNVNTAGVCIRNGIEIHRRRHAAEIFGDRRHEIIEHLVIRTVDLDPVFCPQMVPGIVRPEQFAEVICPLIRESFGADQGVDQLVALRRIRVAQEYARLFRSRQKAGCIEGHAPQKFRVCRKWSMRNMVALHSSQDKVVDIILMGQRRERGRRSRAGGRYLLGKPSNLPSFIWRLKYPLVCCFESRIAGGLRLFLVFLRRGQLCRYDQRQTQNRHCA